jgi:histidinol phosphatase-like enzyme (inositol monophosphatase family)
MKNRSYRKEIEVATKAAKLAGQLAMRWFRRKVAVERKGDQTPVTIVDSKSEEIIISEIIKAFPNDDILGEESGGKLEKGRRCWVIDPIDGTKNFVRGLTAFGTLIGLVEDGACVAGVVNLPAMEEMYVGAMNMGAKLNGKSIKVSGVTRLQDASVVFSPEIAELSAGSNGQALLKLFPKIHHRVGFLDCVSYAHIAAGMLDGIISIGEKPWDIAACKALIESAGGVYTDFHGGNGLESATVVAGNPNIYRLLLRTTKSLVRK